MKNDKTKAELSYYMMLLGIFLPMIGVVDGWLFINYEIISINKLYIALFVDFIILILTLMADYNIWKLIKKLD